MKRKVKFVEPETLIRYSHQDELNKDTLISKVNETASKIYPHKVRIIRERDYQKLLKAARGRK